MTLAAINWLSISINLLLVVFVIVCLLMTLLILMQRPKQEGLGAAFGAGVTDQVFGARTTNVLQRGTVYLGSLFFILSFVLAILIGQQNKTIKLVDDKKPAAEATTTEEAPAAETETAPKSLLEELPVEDSTPAEETPTEEAPAEEGTTEEAPAEESGDSTDEAGAATEEETPAADEDGEANAPQQ